MDRPAPVEGPVRSRAAGVATEPVQMNAWIRIDPDNRITNERLKAELGQSIQALHCSAPNECMEVGEIRKWLEIRNTLNDKYKEAT